MKGIIGFVVVCLVIAGFISMSRLFKLLVVSSGIALGWFIYQANGGEPILGFKLIMAWAGLFIFGVIWSNLDDHDDRMALLRFLAIYGGGYLLFTTAIKGLLYWYGNSWQDADLIVMFLPYKLIAYLVVVGIIHYSIARHAD